MKVYLLYVTSVIAVLRFAYNRSSGLILAILMACVAYSFHRCTHLPVNAFEPKAEFLHYIYARQQGKAVKQDGPYWDNHPCLPCQTVEPKCITFIAAAYNVISKPRRTKKVNDAETY